MNIIGNIDTSNISSRKIKSLEKIIQEYIQISFGLNFPKMSILQNIPRHGGMRSVMLN